MAQCDQKWFNQVVQTVKVSELKAKLSGYLAQVRRGATVTVCDRRTPIARLVPFEGDADGLEVREAVDVRSLPTATRIALRKPVDPVSLLRADREHR